MNFINIFIDTIFSWFLKQLQFQMFFVVCFCWCFFFFYYFIFLLLVAISSWIWHPFTEVPVRPLKTLLWSTKLLGTYIFALCIWKGLTSLVKTATGHSLSYAGCWAPAVYTFLYFVIYLFLSCFLLILISWINTQISASWTPTVSVPLVCSAKQKEGLSLRSSWYNCKQNLFL